MRIQLLMAAIVAAGGGACAKDANQIGATYISPITYENYSCPQLAEEAQRVSSRAASAAGVQDEKATNDKWAMGLRPGRLLACATVHQRQRRNDG